MLHTTPTPHPNDRRWLMWSWLALCLVTLAWDASGQDLPVMRLLGTAEGFPLRHHPLLERVFHDGGRQASTVLYGLLLVWSVWPDTAQPPTAPSRRERLTVLALVTLALAVVSLLKRASHTSCPWEWSVFGGDAAYVSHWDLFTLDGGGGHCFPGGHASSAMAFFALCLPWLWSPVRARRTAPGWRWLAAVLVTGAVAGIAQTLRGAHPPSHTLWTALICTGVALAGWRLALPRLAHTAPIGPVLPVHHEQPASGV